MATHTPGISAVQLQRQLGISQIATAWFLLHRLRQGMVRQNREPLSGITDVVKYSVASVRATITVPPDLYATLKEIATQKKVSLAWVVREAAEQYLTEKSPLLRGQG